VYRDNKQMGPLDKSSLRDETCSGDLVFERIERIERIETKGREELHCYNEGMLQFVTLFD